MFHILPQHSNTEIITARTAPNINKSLHTY